MDEHKVGIPVLARFPDLNDGIHHSEHNKTAGLGLLASSSRLIGQASSVKLLAGTALFLLVGAVLPLFCIGKNPPPANSSPSGDSCVASQPTSANGTLETAPDADQPVALTASRPIVRVVAAQGPSSAPAMLPPSSETKDKMQPGPATDEPQMSSRWNPPTVFQPAAVAGEASQPGAKQPTAVRSAEYDADRAGSTPWNDRETRR